MVRLWQLGHGAFGPHALPLCPVPSMFSIGSTLIVGDAAEVEGEVDINVALL